MAPGGICGGGAHWISSIPGQSTLDHSDPRCAWSWCEALVLVTEYVVQVLLVRLSLQPSVGRGDHLIWYCWWAYALLMTD